MVANLAVLQSAAKTVTWEFSRLFKRLQTSDWFICIQATSPLQMGGGGAGISNSQNSTFLATVRASNEKCGKKKKKKKLTCHTHQIHSLPATMKSMSAVFNDIHNANDHRAPEPRNYLFFSQPR